MNAPEPADDGLASDVELDLLLLQARASAVGRLRRDLNLTGGLAAIQARPAPGDSSRPPPARP